MQAGGCILEESRIRRWQRWQRRQFLQGKDRDLRTQRTQRVVAVILQQHARQLRHQHGLDRKPRHRPAHDDAVDIGENLLFPSQQPGGLLARLHRRGGDAACPHLLVQICHVVDRHLAVYVVAGFVGNRQQARFVLCGAQVDADQRQGDVGQQTHNGRLLEIGKDGGFFDHPALHGGNQGPGPQAVGQQQRAAHGRGGAAGGALADGAQQHIDIKCHLASHRLQQERLWKRRVGRQPALGKALLEEVKLLLAEGGQAVQPQQGSAAAVVLLAGMCGS